jgi:hypothetical protein
MGVIGPPIGAALLNVIDIRWVLVIGTVAALIGVGVFSFAGMAIKRAERLRARQRNAPGHNQNNTPH